MPAMRQSLACVLSLALLIGPAWGASSSALAVVTMAERAQLRSLRASAGDTVFGGDILSTDDVGALRVRAGAAQFQLFASSSAAVTPTSTGIRATLRGGTLALASANSAAIEVQASEARIRVQGNGPTQAQVTLVSPRELLVTARRGTLEISVDDETQIVPEAASYRVLIDPAPQQPEGAGTKPVQKRPKYAARVKFIYIPLGAITLITIIAVHEAWESPDHP
jgi:hypothetical protein